MDKQELIDALSEYKKTINELQTEKQKAFEAKHDEKVKALESKIADLESKSAEAQKQLDAQNIALQKAQKVTGDKDEVVSLEKAMRELLESDEFKKAKADKFAKNNTFTVKADTSNITGTVNMTMQNLTVGFAPERQLAFIPGLSTGFVGQDKNRVLWVEGSYTSNAGYVGEGTGQATADAGTAVEKSRAMAKISAKLPLTAELLEDAEYIASAFRMKMQEKALLFTDGEVYDGDGNDSTQPNHIYGIKGHATAFDATVVPAASKVDLANIGDLVDAVILQAEVAEQRGLNTLWINPKDFFRFKTAKDAMGQYLFVKDVNGNYTINGLRVVRTSRVPANQMTVADSSKIQLWWKRNPEIKFSQMNSTDFVDDKYTAVMFLRNQVVVEGPDKTAVIHVSDIDAAIAAITKVGA
jgi:HK97 family phage major capsid protein